MVKRTIQFSTIIKVSVLGLLSLILIACNEPNKTRKALPPVVSV